MPQALLHTDLYGQGSLLVWQNAVVVDAILLSGETKREKRERRGEGERGERERERERERAGIKRRKTDTYAGRGMAPPQGHKHASTQYGTKQTGDS